jgi:hypothetical protein
MQGMEFSRIHTERSEEIDQIWAATLIVIVLVSFKFLMSSNILNKVNSTG